jgi:hypothetical protein
MSKQRLLSSRMRLQLLHNSDQNMRHQSKHDLSAALMRPRCYRRLMSEQRLLFPVMMSLLQPLHNSTQNRIRQTKSDLSAALMRPRCYRRLMSKQLLLFH